MGKIYWKQEGFYVDSRLYEVIVMEAISNLMDVQMVKRYWKQEKCHRD